MYDKYELAIFKNGNFVQPRRLQPVPAWADIFEDWQNSVAGYVPVEQVQAILEDLCDYA